MYNCIYFIDDDNDNDNDKGNKIKFGKINPCQINFA